MLVPIGAMALEWTKKLINRWRTHQLETLARCMTYKGNNQDFSVYHITHIFL